MEAEVFFELHPGGPSSLSAGDHRQLDDVLSAVEMLCDADQLSEFGTSTLEPWSAQGGSDG